LSCLTCYLLQSGEENAAAQGGAGRSASSLDQNTLDREDQEREEKAEEQPPGKSIVFIQQVI